MAVFHVLTSRRVPLQVAQNSVRALTDRGKSETSWVEEGQIRDEG